ncbi:MAG: NAD(P)/FAD-dependent oxidoreductase [Bryobacteraceae bacterium]
MATRIAIIGAGLIGSSIAWRLAQGGADVTLIDAGVFGGETSSAGAGMLSPGSEFDRPSAWLDLGLESLKLYPAFVEELREETGVAIDFRLCGCKVVMQQEQARRIAAAQLALGIRAEICSEGLRYPEEGFVDPLDLLRALRRACEKRRVRLIENRRVAELESTEHDAVVIAAGAWSDQIRVMHGGKTVSLPPVRPVKGHLIGFQLAAGALEAMMRCGHAYVLQRSSGFLVAGSNEQDAGFDRAVDESVCEEIHRRAADLFPALANFIPIKKWIGFRPFSPEGPHIGPVSGTNVWLAYGHFRNGILLTPVSALRAAKNLV